MQILNSLSLSVYMHNFNLIQETRFQRIYNETQTYPPILLLPLSI